MSALDPRVLEPARIALIGASSDPLSLSGRYLHHLRLHHYGGEIVPVNPRRDEIAGLPCVPSIGAIEEPVDTALVLVDGAKVEGVVAECADAGVPGVVVFSSGFGEAGPEGQARQDRIVELLAATGGATRLLGPNSPGFVNYHAHTAVAASGYLQQAELIPGDAAILSQSGAIGGIVASRALDRGIGLSHLVFAGNEADVTVSDLIETLADDDRVGCIVVIAEALRDLARFRAAAELATARGKTLVVLRIGVSDSGQRAAMAHTGALADDAATVEALLDRVGAISVPGMDELVDLLDARRVAPAGGVRRLGVLCTSGGLASLSADVLDGTAVELPHLSDRAATALGDLIPDFGSTLNPTDLTGMIVQQPELVEHCLVALEDDRFDAIAAILTVHPGPLSITLAEHLIAACGAVRTPVVVAWESGSISYPGIERLRAAGIPTFNSLSGCLGALARLAPAAADPIAVEEPAPAPAAADGTTVPELRALELLRPHGLEGPESGLAASSAEAAELAERIGYPVVAKLQSERLPHRAKLGGVRLGLGSRAEVEEAYAALEALGGELGIPLDGISIARAVPAGLDVFAGARRTDAGWLVVVAPGGVDVERAQAVWRTLLPIRRAEAESAIARTFPDADAVVRAAILDAVLRFEGVLDGLRDDAIVIELNPLRIVDGAVVVLDALVELEPGQ